MSDGCLDDQRGLFVNRYRRAAGLAAGIVVLASAGACTGGSGDTAPSESPPPQSSSLAPPGSPSPGATSTASESSAEEAGVDLTQPIKPVATITQPFPVKDAADAEVTVDLLGLQRRDKLLVATFRFTPSTDTETTDSLYRWLGSKSWSPSLIDPVNLKRYTTVNTSGQGLLQSEYIGNRVGDGQPLFVYAVFAAPPADVTKLDVSFNDSFPLMKGVPLQ